MTSNGPFPGRGPFKTDARRAERIAARKPRAAPDPDGLPPTKGRWIPRRKAQLLAALSQGLIGVEEACARYDLSPEELASWQHAVKRDGLAALKITRLVRHRRDYLEGGA